MIYALLIAVTVVVAFVLACCRVAGDADALSEQFERQCQAAAERTLGIGGGAFTFEHDGRDSDA